MRIRPPRTFDSPSTPGRAGARKALAKVGGQIVNDVRVSLSSPVFPSAPGGPPVRRTGRLQASYRAVVRNDVVIVKSTAPYAAVVEFGDSRQPARPALRPAVNRARVTIPGTIAAGWEDGVRSAARGMPSPGK